MREVMGRRVLGTPAGRERRERAVGIGASLFMIASGAILKYALPVSLLASGSG